MSYEYMQGFGALGAAGQQQSGSQQRTGPGRRQTAEHKALAQQACGGERCSDPPRRLMMNASAPDKERRLAHLEGQGCTVQCEENNFVFLCCPKEITPFGRETRAPAGPEESSPDFSDEGITPSTFPGDEAELDSTMMDPALMPLEPVEEAGGFPWGTAIVGLLLLGGAGFAGYWFLLRDKDEEEDDADDTAGAAASEE